MTIETFKTDIRCQESVNWDWKEVETGLAFGIPRVRTPENVHVFTRNLVQKPPKVFETIRSLSDRMIATTPVKLQIFRFLFTPTLLSISGREQTHKESPTSSRKLKQSIE